MSRGKEFFWAVLSPLNVCASSPQVKLVSTVNRGSVSVNGILLSLVSDLLSSVLKEVLRDTDGTMEVLVPVKIDVLINLVEFLSKGFETFNTKAELVAVGQAAELLGISTDYWGVEITKKTTELNVGEKTKEDIVGEKEGEVEDGGEATEEAKTVLEMTEEKVGAQTTEVKDEVKTDIGNTMKKKGIVGEKEGEGADGGKEEEANIEEKAKSVVERTDEKVGAQTKEVKVEVKTDRGNLMKKINSPILCYYNCYLCQMTYKTKYSFDRHNAIVHGATVATYKCELCHKTFYRKYTLDVHNSGKKHKEMMDNWGVTRTRVELKTEEVNVHLNEEVAKFVYDCDPCQMTFKNGYSFALHNSRVHGALVASYECELCQKTFIRKQDLDIHKLGKKHKKILATYFESTDIKKCRYEVKVELPKLVLPENSIKKVPKVVSVKKEVKPSRVCMPRPSGYGKLKFMDGKWVCSICHVPFDNYYQLNPHLDQVHNVKVSKYYCNVCKFKTYEKSKYKNHILSKKHLLHLQVSDLLNKAKAKTIVGEGNSAMYKEEDHTDPANNNTVGQLTESSEIFIEEACGGGDGIDKDVDIDPLMFVQCELEEKEVLPKQKFVDG